jgi:ribosomal protein S4E
LVFLAPPPPRYVATHDGRTIRYPSPDVKVGDTVKVDIATGAITEHVSFEVGNTVIVTGGHNQGRVGIMTHREKHLGSFEIIHIQDANGHEFATRIGNVFVIGKGPRVLVSLPRGKGLKLTIVEEREEKFGPIDGAVEAE